MWIKRSAEKKLVNIIKSLEKQVLIVRGARQVGKTAVIERCLDALDDMPNIRINLLHPNTIDFSGQRYYGRDFFGKADDGSEFLRNLRHIIKSNETIIVFIDECDRYPLIMEAIQNLSQFTDEFRFVLTGSNLENLAPKNAATGRKRYYDLYPIGFKEFLEAIDAQDLIASLENTTINNVAKTTDFLHGQLEDHFSTFMRLGGMPRLLTSYIQRKPDEFIASTVQDLATTIEENVKAVLGEKIVIYQYHDFLHNLCRQSLDTLKFSRVQSSHVSRNEAKRLVAKTVGARVAHKIRLWDSETDLSKYVLFDSGIANYLLAGSSLLANRLIETELAVLLETSIGNEIVRSLKSRDDLLYWKSENRAEVDFAIRSPRFTGIDVKAGHGAIRSLASMATREKATECIVKISNERPKFFRNYEAKSHDQSRIIPFIQIPHYLSGELTRMLDDI